MPRFVIEVHPADGSFDPKRDLEVVVSATEAKALAFVRTLPWVKATKATLKVQKVIS